MNSARTRRLPWLPIAAAALLLTACTGAEPGSSAPGENTAESEAAPRLLDGLGDHHHPITTGVPRAQRYFDQGLVLTFGFNHDAAVRAFEEAARVDPECAMCSWGIALALGPNINLPMGPEAGQRAFEASRKAVRLASGASARERAYIEALAARYAADPSLDRAALDLAYAEAMRTVHLADPEDPDAATLLAEALMNLYPWDYWTSDGEPRKYTPEILSLLEAVLERQPTHVGANHYYIHAVEEFFPERAVAAADRLGDLAPDAGHLVHMPSHIFWRVGRYNDALEINRRAAAADESFFAWCRAGTFYRAAYYPHNVHFLWAAASTEGRSEIALSSARKLAASVSDQVADFPFVEEFLAIPAFTLARFGRWDALLGEPQPAAQHRYLTGVWHYTRGLALARTGALEAAESEWTLLREVADEEAAHQLVLAGGTATASQLLAIGDAHLEGELAAAAGDAERAARALTRAVSLQDGLAYMEPPPWYFPVRQALGAVLLDADHAAEAEAVYRRDLEQYPSNGWSLYGLAESLRRQGREADSVYAEQGFRSVWARADVELTASRF